MRCRSCSLIPKISSSSRRRASSSAEVTTTGGRVLKRALDIAPGFPCAELTDAQKMIAELFDNKISSLGFSALFVTLSRGFTLDQFVHYDFLTNVAAFDGGIATWNQKYRYDAVRPVTAIRFLYGDRSISGWGGQGRGTVAG